MVRRVAAIILSVFLALALPVAADVTVTVMDVGQGDAIWVHDDLGHDVLIDAGDSGHADTVLAYVATVADLDAVVWTHGHADHIGGMAGVISAVPVEQVICSGYDYGSVTFSNLVDLTIDRGIPMVAAAVGAVYEWGECTALVLHPDRRYSNENNNSVVIKLSCGEADMLLTGDSEVQAETAMVAGGLDLGAEALKVGHHGSSTATSAAFLDTVDPDIAIISVGAGNSYGHPTQETLSRLAGRGIRTLRTDLDGTVALRTDGTTWTVVGDDAPPVLWLPIVMGP